MSNGAKIGIGLASVFFVGLLVAVIIILCDLKPSKRKGKSAEDKNGEWLTAFTPIFVASLHFVNNESVMAISMVLRISSADVKTVKARQLYTPEQSPGYMTF